MSAFHYLALNLAGEKQKGVLEADSAKQVRAQLRAKKLTPIEVTPVVNKKKSNQVSFAFLRKKRLKSADLTLVTRQMATLLAAGLPLDEVLTSVVEQNDKPQIKEVMMGVRSSVLEGFSLASSLEKFPDVFPALYSTTISSGEHSGKLDQVLERLADYTEKQEKIKKTIKQGMVYPVMMTVVSIAIVVFLMLSVVPKIVGVFKKTGQMLPTPTKILLLLSHMIAKYGIVILLALVLFTYLIRRLLRIPRFREKYDTWLLHVPVIGQATLLINSGRFARTFGILLSATVPVLEAMKSAAKLILNVPMNKAVADATRRVSEGAGIADALRETHYFPPMFIQLVASGEASSSLDAMLAKIADDQDDQVSSVIQTILTLFEPLMILFMGAVVLFIVLAVMLPIFSMDSFGG